MPYSSISKANALEKIGEFWDRHDFTEFDDTNLPDAEFSFSSEITNSTEREDF